MRINISRQYPQDMRRKILDHLIRDFCDDYDMSDYEIKKYVSRDEKHLGVLIRYLEDQGYRVGTFSLTGLNEQVLSWGLEFNDGCELMLALRLRYQDAQNSGSQ